VSFKNGVPRIGRVAWVTELLRPKGRCGCSTCIHPRRTSNLEEAVDDLVKRDIARCGVELIESVKRVAVGALRQIQKLLAPVRSVVRPAWCH